MESDVKNPVWKMLIGYIVLMVLLIVLSILTSCGARKSDVKIDNTKSKQDEKSTSEGQVKKEHSTSNETVDKQKNNDVEQNLKQAITELYNENGTLKSRITTLEKQKTDKSSSNDRRALKTANFRTDSNFTNTLYRTVTITTHVKDKKTESSNKQWGWVVGVALVVLILAYFTYRYFKPSKTN